MINPSTTPVNQSHDNCDPQAANRSGIAVTTAQDFVCLRPKFNCLSIEEKDMKTRSTAVIQDSYDGA